MGTKETSEKLLDMLHKRAEREAMCPNDFKTTLRLIELVKILQSLGAFCFVNDDGTTPALSFRGYTYVFDMVEPHHLGFYMDVASFDDDDDLARGEMYALFNQLNWTSFLINAYEVNGQVVISSSQYVGERKIFFFFFLYMMKAMEEAATDIQRMIKRNEYLIDNAICV